MIGLHSIFNYSEILHNVRKEVFTMNCVIYPRVFNLILEFLVSIRMLYSLSNRYIVITNKILNW